METARKLNWRNHVNQITVWREKASAEIGDFEVIKERIDEEDEVLRVNSPDNIASEHVEKLKELQR